MRTTIAMATLLMAPSVFGGTFEYKIDNHPDTGVACHQMARELGARFGEVTGITPLSAECVDISAQGLDFVIRYEAEKPLQLVSTARLGLVYHEEAYTDRESCNADLADQTARFERATGLEAFVSYCYRDQSRGSADYDWAIRIDGFGEPRLRPQLVGTFLFGSPIGHTRETFTRTVAEGLEANGVVEIASVRLHGRGGYTELAIILYADEWLSIDELVIAKVDTQEQCAAGRSAVRDALVNDGGQPLVLYCSAQRVGGYYEVAGIIFGNPTRIRTSAERFDTYSACMADRDRLTDFYRDELGLDVQGSLCGRATSSGGVIMPGWRLILLVAP